MAEVVGMRKSPVQPVYSTNNGMGYGAPEFNRTGGAIAIGRGTDGLYSIHVISNAAPLYGPRPDGFTLLDRHELALIRDAINVELARP